MPPWCRWARSARDDLALLADARGVSLHPDTIDGVHALSAGNPFFALQLLGHLADDPTHEFTSGSLPVGVREWILQRVDRLGDRARDALGPGRRGRAQLRRRAARRRARREPARSVGRPRRGAPPAGCWSTENMPASSGSCTPSSSRRSKRACRPPVVACCTPRWRVGSKSSATTSTIAKQRCTIGSRPIVWATRSTPATSRPRWRHGRPNDSPTSAPWRSSIVRSRCWPGPRRPSNVIESRRGCVSLAAAPTSLRRATVTGSCSSTGPRRLPRRPTTRSRSPRRHWSPRSTAGTGSTTPNSSACSNGPACVVRPSRRCCGRCCTSASRGCCRPRFVTSIDPQWRDSASSISN